MKRVFLDTVGLLGLWDEDDSWHGQADLAWRDLVKERAVLFTTAYVLPECGNAVARTPFRRDVDEMRLQLERSGTLIHPTEEDWSVAWSRYEKSDGAGAGIVDQMSFIVMRRLGITDAFTNDRHFQAAGFTTLF